MFLRELKTYPSNRLKELSIKPLLNYQTLLNSTKLCVQTPSPQSP